MLRSIAFGLALAVATPSFVMVNSVSAADVAVDQKALSEKVQASIDKGVAFLKTQQKPDGGWQNEKEPVGITALALKALAQDSKTGSQADFVKKGYAKLLTFQVDSGGIYEDMLANYNTAVAVSALAVAKDPAYKDALDKATAFLKGLQWGSGVKGPKGESESDANRKMWEGGFGYGRHSRPDLSNAQFSITALKEAGLSQDDPAFKRAVAFLSHTQNRSESNDLPFSGNDGGFFYSPGDGGDSEAGTLSDGGKVMQRSYGSMTYAGIMSMLYCGLSKTDPRVVAAVDWVKANWTLEENPGMGVEKPEQAKHGLFYYYHTMARAMHAYGEPTITDKKGVTHDWRQELVDQLTSLQKEDGSWVGEKRWMENNPVLTTSYVLLALEEIKKDLDGAK